jgi:hypothetical protein
LSFGENFSGKNSELLEKTRGLLLIRIGFGGRKWVKKKGYKKRWVKVGEEISLNDTHRLSGGIILVQCATAYALIDLTACSY